MCRSKKTSKLLVTGLCAENSPGTGEFPAQKASNAEMFPFDDVIMYLSTLGLKLVRVSKRDLNIYYDSFYTHRNGNLFLLTIFLISECPWIVKPLKCYFDEIVITGRSCQFCNIWCMQWRKFRQDGDMSVSKIHNSNVKSGHKIW